MTRATGPGSTSTSAEPSAAAVFDDPEAVKFTPLSAKVRFTALTSGEIDILSRNTTWTMSRDTDFGEFVGVNYYDGQGFMVPIALEVSSAEELDGAAVCTNTGTDHRAQRRRLLPLQGACSTPWSRSRSPTRSSPPMTPAAATSTPPTVRASPPSAPKLSKPDDHIVLPELISKEPLGPLVRSGDSEWGDIARWTLNCMINAEEAGISSENVEEMKGSDDPNIARILGADGDLGSKIGLPNEFCAQVVATRRQLRGELQPERRPRHPSSKLDRGLNALWSDGGVLYAPPMR